MLAIVMCVLFPVRTLIDCISVVVSCWGSRDFVCTLVSTKFMFLWTRVINPPPPSPLARSCRMVVKFGNDGVLCLCCSFVSCRMAMCMLCCVMKCSSSCFLVLMPSTLSCSMLMLRVRCVLVAARGRGCGEDGGEGEGGGEGEVDGKGRREGVRVGG